MEISIVYCLYDIVQRIISCYRCPQGMWGRLCLLCLGLSVNKIFGLEGTKFHLVQSYIYTDEETEAKSLSDFVKTVLT